MRSFLVPALIAVATVVEAQTTWVVDSTPVLDLRGADASGSVAFGHPAGGIRLSNGSLLIADRGDNSVRLFDARGVLQRTSGRTGQGPGEFQSMIWAGRCGTDSLLVWDMNRRRATIVDASGGLTRQFAIPAADTAQTPFRFSCASRGGIVYQSAPRPARGAPNAERADIIGVNTAVYRIDRDGRVTLRLGDVPGGEVVAMTSPSGGRGAAPRPLGRAAHVAAVDGAVAISSADSAFVTMIRDDGSRNRFSLPIAFRAPTRAEFDAAIQSLATMAPAPARQAMIRQLSGVPMPSRLPPVSALFTDADGLLWVQTTPAGGTALDFLVVQADGRVVSTVRIPFGLSVFDIGRDHILGSYTDSDDEMHLVVLRLRRD
ncbi:MAG TPA: hypothetical protein VFZ73_19125 [Gemmatimonadaceae bacterium]